MTEASSPMVNVASLFTWCYIGFGAVLGTARPGASLLVKRPSAHDIDAAMELDFFLLVWAAGDSIERENPDDGDV